MTLYLNKKPYTGLACYINGYNGYTRTKDDGILCALINNSAWNKQGKANKLTNDNGNIIQSHDKRGEIITI